MLPLKKSLHFTFSLHFDFLLRTLQQLILKIKIIKNFSMFLFMFTLINFHFMYYVKYKSPPPTPNHSCMLYVFNLCCEQEIYFEISFEALNALM